MENPMDGGALWAAVYGVARSRTRLSDFTLFFHFHALEKEMATHSIVLAWRIPGMGEPGGLPSMGSHKVGYNWSDLAAAAPAVRLVFMVCIRVPQTPVRTRLSKQSLICIYCCLYHTHLPWSVEKLSSRKTSFWCQKGWGQLVYITRYIYIF